MFGDTKANCKNRTVHKVVFPLSFFMQCFTLVSFIENVSNVCLYNARVPLLLGAFAEVRKTTVSFVMCVRQSFCPHGTTRLPRDGLS
jgi:hypothetical protein